MVDVASKYASVIRHTSQHNLGIRNVSDLRDQYEQGCGWLYDTVYMV